MDDERLRAVARKIVHQCAGVAAGKDVYISRRRWGERTSAPSGVRGADAGRPGLATAPDATTVKVSGR